MSQRHSRAKASNTPSKLLSNTENQTLYNIIGNKAVTLSSAIVQVYLAEAPNRGRWNKRWCGVATFVKDNQKRSYYIRVYNLKNRNMLWEQEVYTNFKYTQARPYFHTFEAEDCSAGLNFANEDEANQFHNIIIAKLQERAQRKMERRKTQASRPSQQRPQPPRPTVTAPSLPPAPTTIDTGKNKEKKKDNKADKKKKKGKLTKEDIGTPSNFVHVGHVGWDPDKGFLDMDKLDPDMKALFEDAGIDPELLQDKETSQFIYDFIEKSGGIEAIKKEQQSRPLPPTPPRSQPPTPAMPPARPPPTHSTPPRPPPSRRSDPPPPPPPSRNLPPRPSAASPPAPPSRGPPGAPPPPPPNRGGPQLGGPPSAPPPPPPSRNMPPPPPSGGGPPPPPPGGGPPPPPPPGPPPPPIAGGGGGRNDLLSQIRGGASLSHVEESASSEGGDADGRDGLLNQIRGGMALKKVEQQERAQGDNMGGIAGALAAALNSRAKAVQTYDTDSGEDIDEDEWSD